MSEPFSQALEPVPDLLDIVAALPDQYPFLLDSAASGPLGRYSLLLRSSGESLCLSAAGGLSGPGQGEGFLERLNDWYQQLRRPAEAQPALPFCGGWFIYLGYEFAGELEPVLELPPAPGGFPDALAVRCDGAIIIEHGYPDQATLVAESRQTLERMRAELSGVGYSHSAASLPPAARVRAEPDAQFIDAIRRVQDYLVAGDAFQVNLSRAWDIEFDGIVDPVEVYRRLRRANPAPFAGLMHWEGRSLMSSSPERLVEVRGSLVQTRPIAGTHPRGADEASDLALSRDLLAHPKERAEHIMLIDLERNDLGRVCVTGSVEVSELMVVESYAHVHHIVSNVRGKLKKQATPCDVISAVFPGGTITGCPKVRCMQIIAELEQQGRGFYTGAMGYLSRDGQMDLSILIRSLLLSGRRVSLRTGAGIVADSIPERELAETVAKARGLLLALEPDHA